LAAGGNGPVRPFRPTHLGIHLLDETSRLVYVSSGIRQCLGFTPEEMLNKSAYGFVCDGFDSKDYMTLYEANQSAD
ncbi:white collar 2 type of transcription factor, partial [Coemansia spiralis]